MKNLVTSVQTFLVSDILEVFQGLQALVPKFPGPSSAQGLREGGDGTAFGRWGSQTSSRPWIWDDGRKTNNLNCRRHHLLPDSSTVIFPFFIIFSVDDPLNEVDFIEPPTSV